MAADSSDFRQTVPIYLAIILPLIGMTILAAWSIGNGLAAYRVAVSLKEEVILSTDASRLAHELQKERGMSVGYIGSAGQAFGPQLKDQRALTDQMVAEVGARVSADDFAHVSVEAQIRTAERADRVSVALKALAAHRKSVDAVAFSGPEAAGFYTAVIMDLLSLPDDPIIDGQTGELERDVAMYQALLMAKEFAGRERAAGSAGFGAGEFSPQAYGRMVGLLQNQNYLLGRVSKLATQEEKKLVDAALSSPAAQNLAEYREIAKEP